MTDIVISYAHKDRVRAEAVVRALRAEGLSVWWDEGLQPGEPSYNAAIQRALEAAHCVLVLWSAWSVRSDYVAVEAEYARKTRKLIPVLLDDVVDKIPIAFHLAQAANLVEWTGDRTSGEYVKLVNVLTSRIDNPPNELVERVRRLREGIGARLSVAYRRFDRWDALAAGVVSFGAVAAWALFARTSFNVRERWLWGTALFLVYAAWAFARLCVRSAGSGVRWLVQRTAVPCVGLGTAFGAWGVATASLYRLPRISSGDVAVFIARIVDDADDRIQRQLVDTLQANIDRLDLGGIAVIAVPRRVAGDADARDLGRRGGAALVIHGAVSRDSNAVAFTGRLTPVSVLGLFQRSPRTENSVGLAGELPAIRLPRELTAIQSALPLFVAGYVRYHGGDFPGALGYMKSAAASLGHDSAGRERSLSETLLASAHFYLGNTFVALDSINNATEEYRTAIEHSLHPVERGAELDRPQFIQPLNNLGMLLSGMGNVDSALKVFARAGRECTEDEQNRFCAYVWYNLGNTLAGKTDFTSANQQFSLAAKRLSSVAIDTADIRLLGYIHKGRAYSFARLAEGIVDRAKRAGTYELARQEWDSAATTLYRIHARDLPPEFLITRTRVHIGLGEWLAARKTIGSARTALGDHPDVLLLSAVVELCTGHMIESARLVIQYQTIAGAEAVAGMAEYRTLKDHCQDQL